VDKNIREVESKEGRLTRRTAVDLRSERCSEVRMLRSERSEK
jgi:hypothetical protein